MKNFERAYYEHYRTLWAIAVKMLGDEPAAEDVLQDVFTAYYQQSREDGRIRNPKSWLARATVHKCSDVIAYRSRYVEIEQVANTVCEDDTLTKNCSSPICKRYWPSFRTRSDSWPFFTARASPIVKSPILHKCVSPQWAKLCPG